MPATMIPGFPARSLATARTLIARAHARLVRSAAKAGQTAPSEPTITVVREYVESRCTECHATLEGWAGGSCLGCPLNGYMVSRQVLDLEVNAERPALAGWDFLAVVEPLDGGNLLRQVPGADVAEGELSPWRTGAIGCDHCATKRRRAETFIVRADGTDPAIAAGTYKQVGRQCLAAFLGGKSAAAILFAMTIPAIIREAGEGGGGWSGPGVFNPSEFLAWVSSSVRIAGWVSKKTANETQVQATADHVKNLLTPPFGPARAAWLKERETFKPSEDDIVRGAAALAWAAALAGASDYEQNLSLVARQRVLEPSHAGILASAVPAYSRMLGEQVARAARGTSMHIGTIGEKLETAVAVTLERVNVIDTQYGGLHIHSFRAATGDVFVWKTGRSHGSVGEAFALSGTVKAHTEYKGEAQTELSRCKLVAS